MYKIGQGSVSSGTLRLLAFHVTSARGIKPFARAYEVSHDLVRMAEAVQSESLTLADCGAGFHLLAQAQPEDTELVSERRLLYAEFARICGESPEGQPLALAIVLSEAYEQMKRNPDPRIKSIAEFAREASDQLQVLIN
jgi:hypothetical protein